MPGFINGKRIRSLKRVSKSIKGYFIKDLRLFVGHSSHVDMSTSQAVYLHDWGGGFLSILAYGVTDERFAAKFRV
jgi:hypothetical protein